MAKLLTLGKNLSPVRRATLGAVASGVAIQTALIVSGTLAARLLGPEDRGHLALLTLFPAVLAQVGTLGVPASVTYELSTKPNLANRIVRATAQLGLVQAVLLTALHVGIIAIVYFDGEIRLVTAAALSVVGTPALMASFYGASLLQGNQQLRLLNWFRVAPAWIYALAVLALMLSGTDNVALVTLAWVGSYVVSALLSILMAIRHLSPDTPGGETSARRLLSFGLRGVLGYISPVDSFRLDQAVVGLFLTPALLGLYVVALAFTNLPRFVSQSVGMIAFPAIAARSSAAGSWRSVIRFTILATLVSAALAGLLILTVPVLIPPFFGDDFRAAAPLAQLLLPGTVFLAARRVLGDGLRGLGAPGLATVAEISSWAWLIGALAILVPSMEANGVALAISSSYAASLLILVALAAFYRRRSKQSGSRLDRT